MVVRENFCLVCVPHKSWISMRPKNIEVTAVYNHMLDEQPPLFFLHFWRGLWTSLLRALSDLVRCWCWRRSGFKNPLLNQRRHCLLQTAEQLDSGSGRQRQPTDRNTKRLSRARWLLRRSLVAHNSILSICPSNKKVVMLSAKVSDKSWRATYSIFSSLNCGSCVVVMCFSYVSRFD